MNKCTNCGSHAINQHMHGRGGDNLDLCDVCYWRARFDALRDAVAWERECRRQLDCVGRVWEDDNIPGRELMLILDAGGVEVGRLITNESAADCKGKGRKNKIKSSLLRVP